MNDWTSLLQILGSAPRENGTPAIHETAVRLAEVLRGIGLDPALLSYTAHPLRLRLAGTIALLGGCAYTWCLLRRRLVPALLIAIAVPAMLLIELDGYVPLFGWIGGSPQAHVEASIGPAAARQTLIFAAHFDSKTDLLDHVQRAPLELLSAPVTILMLLALAAVALGWHARRWLVPLTVVLVPLYAVGTFASLTAGQWVPERSHGALDDGAACAVLLRLAERLKAEPPNQVQVKLLFLSGEEIGVHGSWVYAAERFRQPPPIPTSVVNLELIGASSDLGFFGRERFSLSGYRADPSLRALVDGAYQEVRGKPLYEFGLGAATDARSFLAHGIPALTLFSDLPNHRFPRGLHSALDDAALVRPEALDATLTVLEAIVRRLDRSFRQPT